MAKVEKGLSCSFSYLVDSSGGYVHVDLLLQCGGTKFSLPNVAVASFVSAVVGNGRQAHQLPVSTYLPPPFKPEKADHKSSAISLLFSYSFFGICFGGWYFVSLDLIRRRKLKGA